MALSIPKSIRLLHLCSPTLFEWNLFDDSPGEDMVGGKANRGILGRESNKWKGSHKRTWLRATWYNCTWFLESLFTSLSVGMAPPGIMQCTTHPSVHSSHASNGQGWYEICCDWRAGQEKPDPELRQYNWLRFWQRLTLKLHPAPAPTRWGIVQASSSWIPQPLSQQGCHWSEAGVKPKPGRRNAECAPACLATWLWSQQVEEPTPCPSSMLGFLSCLQPQHTPVPGKIDNPGRDTVPTYLTPRFVSLRHWKWFLKAQESERNIPGPPHTSPWPARVKGIPLKEWYFLGRHCL